MGEDVLMPGPSIPLVSVVMSVYNGEKYLREAIDSILNQTFKDFEFIIINDGSTDDTLKIIKSYKDPRIMLTSRENKGLVASLNEGIERARGKYIARMDADDISVSERLQLQVEYLESNPCVGLVGSQVALVGGNGKIINPLISRPVDNKDIRLLLGYGTVITHVAVLFKKELIGKVGGYDEKYYLAEDHDLWCRMAEVTKVHSLPRVLVYIRTLVEGVSLSGAPIQDKKIKAVSKKWRIKHPLVMLRMLNPFSGFILIQRSKMISRKLHGYTLKPFIIELMNLIRSDIHTSKWPGLLKYSARSLLKINRLIIEKFRW